MSHSGAIHALRNLGGHLIKASEQCSDATGREVLRLMGSAHNRCADDLEREDQELESRLHEGGDGIRFNPKARRRA